MRNPFENEPCQGLAPDRVNKNGLQWALCRSEWLIRLKRKCKYQTNPNHQNTKVQTKIDFYFLRKEVRSNSVNVEHDYPRCLCLRFWTLYFGVCLSFVYWKLKFHSHPFKRYKPFFIYSAASFLSYTSVRLRSPNPDEELCFTVSTLPVSSRL